MRYIWKTEGGYYSPGFRRFVDLKVGLSPDTPVMPPLPRPAPTGVTGSPTGRSAETQAPQVARVLRAVTEDGGEREEPPAKLHPTFCSYGSSGFQVMADISFPLFIPFTYPNLPAF